MSTIAAFSSLTLISLSFLQFLLGTNATTLTITNNCNDNIWPAVLPNSGSPPLSPSGFLLNPGDSQTLPVPSAWSGRVWARTHCATSSTTANFSCATGECSYSTVDCGGTLSSPATIAEFTINAPSSPDTYSVSVVYGYNLPVTVVPTGAAGSCATVGCSVDLGSANSPAELQLSYGGGNETVGLKSACEAFQEADYCCNDSTGSYSSSKITCKQSSYSEQFKNWCPQARTFADDNTGTTFTCEAEDYVVHFCAPPTPTSTSAGYPYNPTGVSGTIPEGQGWVGNDGDNSSSDSKFGIIIGVSVAVVGIILLLVLWRWCFKSEWEFGGCTCDCCNLFSCSLCYDSDHIKC